LQKLICMYWVCIYPDIHIYIYPVYIYIVDTVDLPVAVLQLFAASFPLAPLIALLVIMADIRIDAWRMLWMFRRPVAQIAQDIGQWLQSSPLGTISPLTSAIFPLSAFPLVCIGRPRYYYF